MNPRRLLLLLPLALSSPAWAADAVPRPEAVLGFRPGDDFKLANYSQMLDYFRRVDAASDRVDLAEIGPSTMGKPMILAIISSPANLAKKDRYREISGRLALAGGLSPEEARDLAKEGKAVVWIDSGLHASEVAHAQHSFELLYTLAASETDEVKEILDQVIVLQMPCLNPDGLDLVVDWYSRNLGTPYEVSPMPWLYHKYVGHDNNRDWYMVTQKETENVTRVLYQEWFPQIVYNHHQTGPFPARIFVPPFADPANPNIPPLVLRGIALLGSAISQRLEAEGKSGVVSRMRYDTWWNGGMRSTPYYHNMVGILTETNLYRYATPRFYPPSEIPERFADGTPGRVPTTFYPNPWKGGWWRLRDPIEYMLSASLAVARMGAKLREDWLYNIYQMGADAIERGRREPPYAFVIPAEQHDPNTAAKLVNTLRKGAVEIHRARSPFKVDGIPYGAGSYVVYMSQPFAAHARDLMSPQVYPDLRQYPGGPPIPPYDVAGYTLSFQMGVRVIGANSPVEAELEPVDMARPPEGAVLGSGSYGYALPPEYNDSFIAVNQLLSEGFSVYRVGAAVSASGKSLGAGAFIVPASAVSRSRMEAVAREVGLPVLALPSRPAGESVRIKPLRLGLYQPWVASMDEGWCRWIFEQFRFPYSTLHDAEIRKGNLGERFDVVVLPAEVSAKEILRGHEPGTVPPEYRGGLGEEGTSALRDFVEAGGTLVALDEAAEFAIEQLDLPVRNSLQGLKREEFFCPGSLLRIEIEPHLLTYGMPREGAAVFVGSPALSINPGAEAKSLARYPEENLLMSGWLLGERHLKGRSALVEVSRGKGRVVLVGFRSQFRGQPHGTFKILFNALVLGSSERKSLP